MSTTPSPTSRHEQLREAFPATVEMLKRRRANDIPAGYIDEYVALQWLDWQGGGLVVTVTGQNICRQILAQRGAPSGKG